MSTLQDDPRLASLTKICLSLPEAVRELSLEHAAFKVRKKIFAYYLSNHHGDGIVSVCCKVLPGDNVQLSNSAPARYYLPAYIGKRGWVGLRLDTGPIDWEEVRELVVHSYSRTAPKSLCSLLPDYTERR